MPHVKFSNRVPNWKRSLVDDPSSFNASAAASLSSRILCRIPFVSSPTIKPFTTIAISSLSTMPSLLNLGLRPTLRPSVNKTAFILCSANNGQVIIGTPITMLSSVEFQPQCVRNPPVEL
ncbi:hypothetical protein Ahy_B06g085134 [Arachis hypogaea]|uniref:Uncharacterized protein n=1 Tax=Arachis hypogaea TaxID=3818 RepID=A0A444YTM7_ARAHY|nr:hypothetical protein Ahy_B06g085134 [Arachis hypogaea]